MQSHTEKRKKKAEIVHLSFDTYFIFPPLKDNVVWLGEGGGENRLAWWQRDDVLSFIMPNGKSY